MPDAALQRRRGVPAGREPSGDEVRERVERYWRPYTIAARRTRAPARAPWSRCCGKAIRSGGSGLPFLFEGRLPDLNLGTATGASCSPALQARLEVVLLSAQAGYDWVANGRFKGGHITRHYGDPALGIDAVQLEISQRNYMDEDS